MANASDADFLRALYQGWSNRMAADPPLTLEELRRLFEEWHHATREPESVTYRSDTIAGVEAIWALPLAAEPSKVILYTHGGGFVVCSPSTHRKFAGHLASHLGATAVVFDYRRAPECPFPAQIEDSTAAYRELLARGFAAQSITIAGDSAGGNLAIATVLKLREERVALPGAVIVFSPWLDMECIGSTLESNAHRDALVNKSVVQNMSTMFLGENGSRTHPLANPLKADYKNFPRLYISASGAEALLDNATGLAEIAEAAGVDVTLSLVDDMQHVFPFLAGRAIEADDELRRIANWFKA